MTIDRKCDIFDFHRSIKGILSLIQLVAQFQAELLLPYSISETITYRYKYGFNNKTSYSHCKTMTETTAYLISIFLLFTDRSLIFWEWQHTQLKCLPPQTHLQHLADTAIYNLSEVTGLSGKFWHRVMTTGLCLLPSAHPPVWKEDTIHPGSVAAIFPSRGWMQDVKDGRAGRQGVYVLSGIF